MQTDRVTLVPAPSYTRMYHYFPAHHLTHPLCYYPASPTTAAAAGPPFFTATPAPHFPPPPPASFYPHSLYPHSHIMHHHYNSSTSHKTHPSARYAAAGASGGYKVNTKPCHFVNTHHTRVAVGVSMASVNTRIWTMWEVVANQSSVCLFVSTTGRSLHAPG